MTCCRSYCIAYFDLRCDIQNVSTLNQSNWAFFQTSRLSTPSAPPYNATLRECFTQLRRFLSQEFIIQIFMIIKMFSQGNCFEVLQIFKDIEGTIWYKTSKAVLNWRIQRNHFMPYIPDHLYPACRVRKLCLRRLINEKSPIKLWVLQTKIQEDKYKLHEVHCISKIEIRLGFVCPSFERR